MDRSEKVNMELISQNHLSSGWKNYKGPLFILLILIGIHTTGALCISECTLPFSCLFLSLISSMASSSPSPFWWSLPQSGAPTSTLFSVQNTRSHPYFLSYQPCLQRRSQMRTHFSPHLAGITFTLRLIHLFSRFQNILRFLYLPGSDFLCSPGNIARNPVSKVPG